ncbi:thioredoxin-domain-containing protein [Gloeopeniophorella convolvens]|nr:thioredoxin-domain-containing protein [Gloeopeniophorella convolvens]
MWPSRLPLSLLIASLAFALPVQSAEHKLLAPDTFNDSIASGYWLIEHFSPYCHHCREFAPTWDELVEDYAGSKVNLAQVNCVVHGDLCSANGVNGYPQMNLYHDGAFKITFNGARSHERLVEFLKEQTGVSEPVRQAPPPELLEHDMQTPHAERNPHGEVLALTPETFQSVIADGDVFVKFFAPWCGHCKKLAPTWIKLAEELQHRVTVAEVNCDDHKSLCSSQGVTGFPMLFFYPASGTKTEYAGNRKLEPMKGWVERATKPLFQELQFANFEQTVKDNAVFYLFLHKQGGSVPAALSLAARPLLGSPPIYTSSSPELFKHFSIPVTSDFALVAVKDGADSAAAQLLFDARKTSKELGKWLQAYRLPTAMELGDGSFQDVMKAESEPLVVLVSVPASGSQHDRIVETVRKLASEWRSNGETLYAPMKGARHVVFTWMDQERWASWLKSMYGIQGPGEVVITDHSKLVYFDTSKAGSRITLDSTVVLPTLGDAMKGTLRARHSENVVERIARYLNNKLIAIENMVSNHPWATLGFFGVGVLGVFWVIKRLFLDEDNYAPQHKGGKEARLD